MMLHGKLLNSSEKKNRVEDHTWCSLALLMGDLRAEVSRTEKLS